MEVRGAQNPVPVCVHNAKRLTVWLERATFVRKVPIR